MFFLDLASFLGVCGEKLHNQYANRTAKHFVNRTSVFNQPLWVSTHYYKALFVDSIAIPPSTGFKNVKRILEKSLNQPSTKEKSSKKRYISLIWFINTQIN